MIETILLAILLAKIKGYKIKPLFKSWNIYPILVLEMVYIAMQINIFMGNYGCIKYAGVLKILYLSSYLFLILRYEQYLSAIIGTVFICIGSAMNKIAIYFNYGKMPAFPSLSYVTGYLKPDSFSKVNDIHEVGGATTNFKFLTDIIDLGYSILSIGDVFIRGFAFIVIFNTIKYLNKQYSTECKLDVNYGQS